MFENASGAKGVVKVVTVVVSIYDIHVMDEQPATPV